MQALNLSDLSDTELARMILRRLYQIYSVSGVSAGRSLRSKVVEAISKILPLPGIKDLDQWTEDHLFKETERRLQNRNALQLWLFFPSMLEPKSYDTNLLARTLIHELLAWYQNEGEDYTLEKDFLEITAQLLYFPWPYSRVGLARLQILIEEVERRTYNWQEIWNIQAQRTDK